MAKRNHKVYEAVHARSQGVCERCKSQPASECHHRRLRSQRGADSLLNLIDLCMWCHHFAHNNIDEAAEEMLIVTAKHHGAEIAALYEVAE